MERFTEKLQDYRGLTSDEVSGRLNMYGYNGDSRYLETDGDFHPVRAMFSFRFIVTALVAVVLLFSGKTAEGFVLLLLGLFYAGTEIFKGLRCRDSFCELRRLSSVRFRVLRDGEIKLLRREYIVPDDIIILQEGESVPADAHLLDAQGLTADESLFTGDRAPAAKRAGADSKNELKQTCIYKGTRILSGYLVARVTATGIDTKKFKERGPDADKPETFVTSIERAAGKALPMFYAASCALFLGYLVITIVTKDSATFAELAGNSLIPALCFALCLIPAEVPKLVRSHYLYGAFVLRGKNCVVKDLNAIENLSAITAVCVDKTGIITKNHTNPVDEYTADPEALSKISVLSCDRGVNADIPALDRAIILHAAFKGLNVKTLQDHELICRYPYSEETKIGGNLWNINKQLLLCVKGSPENVLRLCEIQPGYLFSVQQKQQKYAEQGHRVIAAAYAIVDEAGGKLPQSVFDAAYTFVGLAAFENRTRDSAPAAVRSCYKAGVKIIMTTGDSEEASSVIAKKIGMTDISTTTGDYLRECFEAGIKPDITHTNIFARVTADQKPHIVSLLRDAGEIVAVTGIGAADVEALEQASVGVALPQETSGAAKEVCGLVLADDDFNSVVDALKETRQLHYNIKQTVGIALCALVTLAMFAVYCLFARTEGIMSPFVISAPAVLFLPLLSLCFFSNRADIKGAMSASGFVGRGALDKRFLIRALTQGLCGSLAILLLQLFFRGQEAALLNSCFLAGFTSVLIAAVAVNLSSQIPSYAILSKGGVIPVIMGIALLLTVLFIYIPGLNSSVGMAAINPLRLLAAVILGVASQIWIDIFKIRDSGV